MLFYSADYLNGDISDFTAHAGAYWQDVANYRDINRIRSSPSITSCILGKQITYCPSNKKLRRKPMQVKEYYLNEEECVDPLPRPGSINYAKIKKIAQPILFLSAFLGACGVIPLGALFTRKCLFLGMAISVLPSIIKKIALIAVKKIMDTSENIENILNCIEKHCVYSEVITKIALQDFKYLKHEQMQKKYGKLFNGKYELNQELNDALFSESILAKNRISDLTKKILDEELKNQILKIGNNIRIDNFIESFEQLVKILHKKQDTQNNLELREFFYEYFDVFDSLGEMFRIRITGEGPNSEFHHFFIPKVFGLRECDFLQGVNNNPMQESCGLINIKLKDTSLKFWKCFSIGRLEGSPNINDLLEILQEAHKYGAFSLLDQSLQRLEKLIDRENVGQLKTYGEDCQWVRLVELCDSWLDKNRSYCERAFPAN